MIKICMMIMSLLVIFWNLFVSSNFLTQIFFSSQSLLEMGTKDMDFVQLNQLIGRKTGGISVYPFTSSVRGSADPCTHLIVRGKAMAARVEDLFNLVLSFPLPLLLHYKNLLSSRIFSTHSRT